MSASIPTFRIPSSTNTSPGVINKLIGAAVTLAFSADQSFTSLLLECHDCGASIDTFHAYSTKYGARSQLPVSISLHNQMTSRKCQRHFQPHLELAGKPIQVKKSRKRRQPAVSADHGSRDGSAAADRSPSRSDDIQSSGSTPESDSQSQGSAWPRQSPVPSPELDIVVIMSLDSASELDESHAETESTAVSPVFARNSELVLKKQRTDSDVLVTLPSEAQPTPVEPCLPFKLTAFERDAIPALLQVTRQEILATCTEYKMEVLELDGAGTQTLCMNILTAWVTSSQAFSSWCGQHKKPPTIDAAQKFMDECRQKKTMRKNRILRIIFEQLRAHHRQTCRMPAWKWDLPTWTYATDFPW